MTPTPIREAPPGIALQLHVNDPDAFARSYHVLRDRVFWHALRHTGVVHDAEDITALVFLEAWRNRSTVRIVNDSPLAWLLATTNNVARNLARSRRRHREAMERLPKIGVHEDFSGEADARIDREAHRTAIRAAFARLSGRDQDVLSLCVIAEFSDGDAAAALGIPVGTVKSRLSRAKKKLATLLAHLAADADNNTDRNNATGGAR